MKSVLKLFFSVMCTLQTGFQLCALYRQVVSRNIETVMNLLPYCAQVPDVVCQSFQCDSIHHQLLIREKDAHNIFCDSYNMMLINLKVVNLSQSGFYSDLTCFFDSLFVF